MPLRELQVQDAMAKHVLTSRPEDTIEEAEKMMRGGRVRRLPVASEAGSLVGMISLADLAQEAARQRVSSSKALAEMDAGDRKRVQPVVALRYSSPYSTSGSTPTVTTIRLFGQAAKTKIKERRLPE